MLIINTPRGAYIPREQYNFVEAVKEAAVVSGLTMFKAFSNDVEVYPANLRGHATVRSISKKYPGVISIRY